jgi:uncharacterized membrane protein (DUF485 family)
MTLAFLPKITKKAFTAILVGSIMAILIGGVLLVVTYVLLSPIINVASGMMNSTSVQANSSLSIGYWGSIGVIMQALTVTGISMIVAGVSGIIYILMGVAGMTTGGSRGR